MRRSKFQAMRCSKPLILFTICVAMFTDGFIYGIVAPVIPFVLQDQKLVAGNKRKIHSTTPNFMVNELSADLYIFADCGILNCGLLWCT
jgi:hypothetical protein